MDFDHVYEGETGRTYRYVDRLDGEERARASALVRASVAREREAMGLGPVGVEHPARLWCGHPRSALVETPDGCFCSMCP